jgi:cation diffusion facilitator CzcD-associated flavoprotein CzcO
MAQAAGTPHAAARAVAVVGAGAAGLVAARELLRDGHAVSVFEKSSRAGGTWAYDPRTDADPLSGDPGAPGAVHSSLYASLRTNLPRELMGLSGFPLAGRVFAGDPRTFPGHEEVLAFLDAFAEETGVAARVRFRAEVLRVAPLGQEQGSELWEVRWRGDDGVVAEEMFDSVVVCIGRNTVPLVPKIRGACSSIFFFDFLVQKIIIIISDKQDLAKLVSQESTSGEESKYTATAIAFPSHFEIRYISFDASWFLRSESVRS